MERDYMRAKGKDSDESRSNNQKDWGYAVGSAVQWPFSNKINSFQQLMSFNTSQDEKPKKSTFDRIYSSGYQPISTKNSLESIYRAPQKSFSLDRQTAQQFSMYNYPHQSTDHRGPLNSPFVEAHGSSNVVGSNTRAFVPRNISKPTTSPQLTIFYAGSVNVYDNVPLEKAEAIMLMASKYGNPTPISPYQRSEPPMSSSISKVPMLSGLNTNQTMSQRHAQNPVHVSTPIAVASDLGVQSRVNSSANADMAGARPLRAFPPKSIEHEPSKTVNASVTIAQGAVPMARKASVARFLEKRKERLTSIVPYPRPKSSPENNISSKCSSADLSLSSINHEESWCSTEPKNNIDIENSPSTRLEM